MRITQQELKQAYQIVTADFLKKIKRELNIGANVELSPHTLRRSFATYQF